jgi:hypothetical protein
MMFTTVPARMLLMMLLLGSLPGPTLRSAGSIVLGFAPPQLSAAQLQTSSQCFHTRSIRVPDDGTASPPPRPSCRNRAVLYASNENKNRQESQVEKPTYKPADDGRSVGFVLLGMSLLVSAWLFTIPPSFRRAYLCPSDYFASSNSNTGGIAQQLQEQAADCVPLGVWWSDVVAYYQNGGGIQWDFSIDPQTVRDNQEFMDAVITSYSGRNIKSN